MKILSSNFFLLAFAGLGAFFSAFLYCATDYGGFLGLTAVYGYGFVRAIDLATISWGLES